MTSAALAETAQALVADGKGILAADESSPTIKKRFDSIKIASTEENRRDYRNMLFTAPGAGKYISGVILYDETIRQKTADGTPLVNKLVKAGMIPGIKVDMGAKPLAGHPEETVTEGLDGLRARLEDYAKLGAGAEACLSCAHRSCTGACPFGLSIPELTTDAHRRLA